ncbi:MAG: hypothetical protein JRH01_01355 [Deltaproteobacteria bacterium]|nr:hypothetical protein [Deltaproteobacteria bacterium]MBW2394175.1 hypothetical protein [Deltaproteobacteria bacterium]
MRFHWLVWALLVMCIAVPALAQEKRVTTTYDVVFEAALIPTERVVRATIRLGRGASAVRWIQLSIDPERHLDFNGDGEIEESEGHIRWTPPRGGGELHYTFRIDHLRNQAAYDARCAEQWALFRGGDLFPPARVRAKKGAESISVLKFRMPKRWSSAVPYRRLSEGAYQILNPTRLFDRPTGWMLVGRLGILRERIAGSHVAVAGPIGQGVRRQDMLAFLRWTLPALRDATGPLPDRLLIVSAGDPMWRGGLSGPRSAFLHAERPLITTDATSPLLHELVHTQMGARAGEDGDWIVEGLAELYSLEILVRSRSISRRRFRGSLSRLADRGSAAPRLRTAHADPVITARAVGVLHRLDEAIRDATEHEASLDDVVTELMRTRGPVTTESFREAIRIVAGRDLLGAIAER